MFIDFLGGFGREMFRIDFIQSHNSNDMNTSLIKKNVSTLFN